MHTDNHHHRVVGVHVHNVKAGLGAPLLWRLTRDGRPRLVPARGGRPNIERQAGLHRIHVLAQEVQEGLAESLRNVRGGTRAKANTPLGHEKESLVRRARHLDVVGVDEDNAELPPFFGSHG